jgi:hypothetical protein
MIKNVENFDNSSTMTVAKKIHELTDTVGIRYGVYQDILTKNLKCAALPQSLFPNS